MNIPEDPAKKTPYLGLLAFSGLATVAAILTLLPWDAASWPNIWGYKSLCTFTPGATVACALLAALSCIVRNRLVSGNRERIAVPLVVVAVLVGLLAWSTVAWADAKAYYTDAGSAATEE